MADLIARLASWLVAFLSPRPNGRHRADVDQDVPDVDQAQEWRPDIVSGRARRLARRFRRLPPPPSETWQPRPQERAEWFPPQPWEATGAMIRPYVLAHEGDPRTARTGDRINPWKVQR